MTRLLSAALLVLSIRGGAARAEVRFNRDIRPIMADTCFRCHGPDRNARMAGMRLDIRDEALKPTASGATPIVPGHPEQSAVVQRIFATGANSARIMPPAYVHRELTNAQKETIRQWVAEGAKYEGHWAYQPVRRPELPGGGNPVDAFILDRLNREGLHPSPEADRRTLIRRVTLDLTGLPPTPEETAAFVKDTSPNAYEKVVDRLLASPRYAEQQAMHWLDYVRYADTCGFHGDNALPAWPYRDYVLHSIRDNKPFDQFTREQLAGDLLPNPTLEQRTATAYNRLNRTSAEGGLQPKEYLAKYAADRVRTVATVWMGSTLGCAECHDHKFDPFLARDFYSMKAFFADVKETGLVPDRGSSAWGAQLALPSPAQQQAKDDLARRVEQAKAKLNAAMQSIESRRGEWEKKLLAQYESGELKWRNQRPISAEAEHGATLRIFGDEPVDFTTYDGSTQTLDHKPGDGVVIASGKNPDNETYLVTFRPTAGTWKALGLEIVQDESLPGLRVARGADRLVLSEIEVKLGGEALQFSGASSNIKIPSAEYPPASAIDGDLKTGWAIAAYNETPHAMLALRFAQPLHTDGNAMMTVRMRHESEYRRAVTGRFRIALSGGDYSWPDPDPANAIPERVLKALRNDTSKRTDAEKKAIADHYQWAAPEAQSAIRELSLLEGEAARLDAAIPHVVVTEAVKPAEMRILPRGNWMDESGDIVTPAIPAFLGKVGTTDRATRLDLANWLVAPSNPLTARVYVNRVWREFFGTGISKTLDDFGSQGEWPVHPELLDWLATEFMQPAWQADGAHAWDMKHIVRVIITSKTYRQSSANTPALAERDPDNRLLARQVPMRLDAENVRDAALSISGLLAEKFGGPSTKPYQPDGYLAAMNFPTREYSASRGDDLYRRGIYTFWQRSFLHPSLLAFDAPTREECGVNRTNSNTPLQALVLLNDPIYVETARVLAANMLKRPGSFQTRVSWAFERALTRAATREELAILLDLYRKSAAEFRKSPASAQQLIHTGESPAGNANAVDLAAMTMVARAILNQHETITRN